MRLRRRGECWRAMSDLERVEDDVAQGAAAAGFTEMGCWRRRMLWRASNQGERAGEWI